MAILSQLKTLIDTVTADVVAHPQVELLPMHMTPQVERMWLRAIAPKG